MRKRVFQLLGLHWAGEPAEKLSCLVRSLRQEQRKDGGWAQLPTLESDAYATGEALYTLAQFVKDPMTDPAWQRGLRFLLESAGGRRDLARGAAGVSLPADDEERLPAPPRFVDLGGGDKLGGPGIDAGLCRSGPHRASPPSRNRRPRFERRRMSRRSISRNRSSRSWNVPVSPVTAVKSRVAFSASMAGMPS